MLSQETILKLIGDSLELMTELVPLLGNEADSGAKPKPGKQGDSRSSVSLRYSDLLKRLVDNREDDPRLTDEGWSWIWEDDGEIQRHSSLQLYGRLQFINCELFHFL